MPICHDCEEEPASKQWNNESVHYWLRHEPPMLDLCQECWEKRDNYEPPDADGEDICRDYRAEERDAMIAAQRLK